MAGRNPSGSRSWLLVAARRWFSAKPVMTICMQGDPSKGSTHHVHGRRSNSSFAGKPDALKGACLVWREAHGTGPLMKWYLAGCLPYGDIADCFGSLDHGLLLSTLGEHIQDGRFLGLVKKLLDAGYLEEWKLNKTLSGVPQGSILSPVLSNILLSKLDRFVETTLIPRYTRGERRKPNKAYERLKVQARRLRQKGQREAARKHRQQAQHLPSIETHDPDYRRLRYCRYADDFALAFIGPKEEAEEIKQHLRTFLLEELKLKLSEEKTLVTHARSQAAKFLGYEIATLQSNSKQFRNKNGHTSRRINGNIGF